MSDDGNNSPNVESRKSRLEILRERQKKLRESYKSQIQISRKNLTIDSPTDIAAKKVFSLPAVTPEGIPEDKTVTPVTSQESLSLDGHDSSITPKGISPRLEIPITPTSTSIVLLQLQEKNDDLKRQIKELKSDRDTLLSKQTARFESASNQLNELEELLEDYRTIAEETEEINAVLKAKNSLLKSENETLKKENEKLQKQVEKQEERILESCTSMNDLENDLIKTQDELDASEKNVRSLQHQVQNLSTPVFTTTHIPQPMSQQTPYYPPQQTTFYHPPPPTLAPPETTFPRFGMSAPSKTFVPGVGIVGGQQAQAQAQQTVPNFMPPVQNSSFGEKDQVSRTRNSRNNNKKKRR